MDYFEALSQTPVFRGLSPAAVGALFENKLYRTRKFEKDGIIALNGDECVNLMVVVQGDVRGEMTDFSGKTIKIEDISAPRPLAPAFLFGGNNRFPVDIVANCPATIFVIPRDTFIQIMQENSLVLGNFLDTISNRAQFLSNKIRFLSFKTIKGKIAYYFLKLARGNTAFELPANQAQLADFFGVTRPSLARTLGELEKEGILKVDRKRVTITNPVRLKELVN